MKVAVRPTVIAALAALVVLTGVHVAGAQLPSSMTVTLTSRPRDVWDYLAQVAAPLGTIVAIVGLIITMWWNARSLKLAYFTKEWSTLMQFVQQRAKFMDPARARDYRNTFRDDDAMQYELVARLCIGYLDDLYFLGSKRQVRGWFRGSVRLLAGTHRAWLDDHQDSYDPKFYAFVVSELKR